MYNRNKSNNGFFTGMPLFFKLWFAFIVFFVLAVWGLMGYGIYTIGSDPAAIGRAAGDIVSGFNERVK
jgi:hypothetical protein